MLKLLPLVCPARTAVMRASIGVMSLAAGRPHSDADVIMATAIRATPLGMIVATKRRRSRLKQPARGQGLRSAAS